MLIYTPGATLSFIWSKIHCSHASLCKGASSVGQKGCEMFVTFYCEASYRGCFTGGETAFTT